jgi:hypothetical protein
MMEDLRTTVIILVVLTFFITLIAGASNRVVIYFDKRDFLISFMPWGSLALGWLLIYLYSHDEGGLTALQMFFFYLSITSFVIFFIWAIVLSIFYNKSFFLGLFLGIIKTLSALIGVVILVMQLIKIGDDESDTKDALLSAINIGMLFWFGSKLINGKAVYLAKGWELPKRSKP